MQTTTHKQTKILKRSNSPGISRNSLTKSLGASTLTKHGDKKEEYEESTVQTMGKANAFSKNSYFFLNENII